MRGCVSKAKNSAKEESGTTEKPKPEAAEGLFEGSDVVMALEAGNTKEAKAVIQEMTDNGKK